MITYFICICVIDVNETLVKYLSQPLFGLLIVRKHNLYSSNEKMKILDACDVPAFWCENNIGAMLEHCKSLI